MRLLNRLVNVLAKRSQQNKLRGIHDKDSRSVANALRQVDFSSNDYLGLSRSRDLFDNIQRASDDFAASRHVGMPIIGSSGSRLLTGDSRLHHDTERVIRNFHGFTDCLICNSGWDANFGLLSCITNADSVVIYDELCHNSLIKGIRSGRTQTALPFRHNCMLSLRKLLDTCGQEDAEKIIVIETLYSMDGDMCPLEDVLDMAAQYGAMVIVDEAHSTGWYGSRGEGMVTSLGLTQHPALLGVVYTFGKAFGAHGAAVLSNHACLKQFLANYSAPLVYSTSLPMHSLITIQCAYEAISSATAERAVLRALIAQFQAECKKRNLTNILSSASPIQGLILPGNNVVVEGAAKLQARGFQCLPIRSPTVPTGQERIRIVLHAHNTAAEISALCECLEEVMDEYAYITDRSDTPSACSKKNDAEMTERIYSEA